MEGGTGYLVVGYVLTWGVLAWYARRLIRRSREVARALGEEGVEPNIPSA